MKLARCVVVVLSTDLREDKNCIFCLNHVIPIARHIVFVIHDIDYRNDNHLVGVGEDVRTILTCRRQHIVWPSRTSDSLRIKPADVEGDKSWFEEAEVQNQLVHLYNMNLYVVHTFTIQ